GALDRDLRLPFDLPGRERAARRPAWLDEHARPGPAVHARDRGGTAAGLGLVARRRGRPARRRGAHRRDLRRLRLPAVPLVRDPGPASCFPRAVMKARELNWMQVDEYLSRDDRVVLPVGSTEQHGYVSLETGTILA